MMFSATSLADARSAAGSACSGSVPLIGLDVTCVARAAQEQFRRQRRHRAPVAGQIRRARRRRVRATASAKKSIGDPVSLPVNWVHTHAW